jgi:enediyne biosynthesis protein E5
MAFGGGVAVLYAFFMIVHVAYGLFFATATVCLVRGGFLWALHITGKARERRELQVAAVPAAPVDTEKVPA